MKLIFTFVFVLLSVNEQAVRGAEPNFQDDVLPIFKQHCLGCHNADKQTAGLNLSSAQTIQAGSSSGPVVKAGLPETSPLFMAVNHHDDYVAMPLKKPKLAKAKLETIHRWIAAGLIESKGGKSQLRKMRLDVSDARGQRPEKPAFPENLPPVPVATGLRPMPIVAMASSPWANLVAVNGNEQILLYGRKVVNEEPASTEFAHVGTLPFPEGDVHDLRFSRSGELLIAAGGRGADSGKVTVFDVNSGRRTITVGDESDVVLSADITADHQVVAIGTPLKTVKLFSASDGTLLHTIEKHTDWVSVVRFSPDGRLLASADRNGGIHIRETQTAGILYTLDEHKVNVTALAWRSDGKMLASTAEDGRFVLWDMKDGWATRTAEAHAQKSADRYTRRTGGLDITFASDGRFLTAGRDFSLRLWKPDGAPDRQSQQLDALPLRATLSADGQQAFVGDFAGNLTVWDLAAMKPVQTLQPPLHANNVD